MSRIPAAHFRSILNSRKSTRKSLFPPPMHISTLGECKSRIASQEMENKFPRPAHQPLNSGNDDDDDRL
ncbi:hypothetical protein JTE90_018764 [Oedothorax gibbosus]|uniref:Uncharacterized protein n=1 Tax=Oedothorax gibbosus TaxID=931172 RepID=A0AAV6UVC8_9ARAC|nr:hypothetical protein JTE90_018764 [Oedothorax gibbosus]